MQAYNKRATVLYLMDDHEGSISDCRRVLALQVVRGCWNAAFADASVAWLV